MKTLITLIAVISSCCLFWIMFRRLPAIRQRVLKVLRFAVFWLDSFLKKSQRIYEFSSKDECLLRLSLIESEYDMQLADGTRIYKGDCLGELHFWNEHFPSMSQHGADLAWAAAFKRRAIQSLSELARFVEQDPQMKNVKAFCGDTTIGSLWDFSVFSQKAKRWGFEVTTQSNDGSVTRRLSELFKNVYTTALIWAFNPENLNGNKLWKLRRDHIWISRQTLVGRYGIIRDRVRSPSRPPKLLSCQTSPKSDSSSVGRTNREPAFSGPS